MELDSGIYNLIIYLPLDKVIKVGSLGEFEFESGYYVYTGTAQRNLLARINRHKSKDKKLHWHIDYLLQEADVAAVRTWEGSKELECQIHQSLLKRSEFTEPVLGFGASDCNCNTHLSYSKERPKIDEEVKVD
ncbi:MAG: hypothetical protein AWU54_760 [Candidatus Frackibacter sp. T328-2]|nr:MAG: hypothetical protein AWU54_760 [Candidatus Frackibacter sp. T328-2]